MRKRIAFIAGTAFIFLLGINIKCEGQFSLIGQLRTRTELRNGVGTLKPIGAKAASFTSQRTRLLFGYKWDRLNFNVSVQDVRVWGQDASSISNSDGNKFMVHEAWGEVTLMNIADTTIKAKFLDNLSFKIGRQELIYDDSRLLGNLDWMQQGRRHDALVLKAMKHGYQLDLGVAFNQNNDNFGNTGTSYVAANVPAYVTNSLGVLVSTPTGLLPLAPNGGAAAKSSQAGSPVMVNPPSTNGMNQQYKSMQFAYASKKIGQTKFAALFFKDDFGKFRLDSVGSASAGYVYGRRYDVSGVNSRYTYGMMINGTLGNASGLKKAWMAGAYFQSGKDKDGKKLSAYHYTGQLMLQKGKISFGPGIDYLSGDAPTTASSENHRFDPLYGTPHKFWGYMDYFYAGTGSPVGGLVNPFFKTKYTSKAVFVTLDIHNFRLAEDVLNKSAEGAPAIDKNLGYEFDLVANYTLNKFTSLELGYSYMAANNSMEYVKKGTTDKNNHQPQWAYLMINIRPDFLKK